MNVLETMKQALEALEDFNEQSKPPRGIPLPAEIDTAMDALRAAVAEMEKAEPSLWINCTTKDCTFNPHTKDNWLKMGYAVNPYYKRPAPAVPEGEKCAWTLDNTDCFYHTSCDNSFVLNDGTPAENDMKFCPYCGKTIKEEVEQPWEDEEGEEE